MHLEDGKMAGHTAVQASTGWCFKALCRDFNLQVGWENSDAVEYFQKRMKFPL